MDTPYPTAYLPPTANLPQALTEEWQHDASTVFIPLKEGYQGLVCSFENSLYREQQPAHIALVTIAPEMAVVLLECIKCYEDIRDAQTTGHLWPDPNHIFHAKQVLAKAGIFPDKVFSKTVNGYEIKWNPFWEKYHVSHPEIGANLATFDTPTAAQAYCQNG